MNQGAASAKTFEKQASSAGQTASKALGGLVVAGAAAAGFAVAAFAKQSVQSAIDFDRSMTQIASLTDTSSKRLTEMRSNVLSLAGETAQAPTDLAQAMYFLASAGLTASQQTDTLEASAKAAAVGLGQAGDIARITANALNVYGDNGLKAANVTDTLVAAVREGSAEPDEFAGALGRVLPIADKAGISFQQVAASLATMSNAGLDVNEGVTALRGTLQALIAPTKQTQDALGGIGLTVDDVVNSLQGQGLIATLRMLDDAAKKNTDSTGQYNIVMRELVPNVRALTGVFNLTAQQASKVDAIFKDVTHSSGDLEEAFVTTQEAASFRLHKALNDISIDGQELASKVLPDVATALAFVSDHAKGLLEILTGFAVVKFGSKLASAFNLTVDSLGPLSGLAKRAQANIGGLGLVAVSVGATFTVLKGVWDDAHIDLERLATQTKISADELKFFRDQMDLAGSAFEGHSFEGFVTSLNGVGANLDELLSKLTPVIQRLKDAGLTTGEWNQVIGQLQPLIDGTSGSIDLFVGEVTGAADTIRHLQDEFAHGKIDFATFQQNLTAIGVSIPGTMAIADDSVDKLGKHVSRTGAIVRNFAGMTSEELDKMRADYQKNFNIVGGVLDRFAGKMNLSADKVIAAFAKQLSAVHDYQKNLESVEKRNIPDDILKQITDMGLDGAGFMQLLANASKEQFRKIIGQMEAGATAAGDVTSAILDIPKVHNTRIGVEGAKQGKVDVDALGSSILALPTSTVLDIKVHSHAGSPWPDEALKMHLTDPLGRMGFKKIAGVWTLPLNIGVHSDLKDGVKIGGEFKTPKTAQAADELPAWMQYSLRNVPSLPAGHTHISTNPHNTSKRALKVRLDRRAFSDELSYEVDYGRGY